MYAISVNFSRLQCGKFKRQGEHVQPREARGRDVTGLPNHVPHTICAFLLMGFSRSSACPYCHILLSSFAVGPIWDLRRQAMGMFLIPSVSHASGIPMRQPEATLVTQGNPGYRCSCRVRIAHGHGRCLTRLAAFHRQYIEKAFYILSSRRWTTKSINFLLSLDVRDLCFSRFR